MVNRRLDEFRSTIFAEMTGLALTHDAINLGQGFPDEDGPAEMLREAVRAISTGCNQYPPGNGVPVLRQAVSQYQQDFFDLAYDPDTEVLVTVGASEAICASAIGVLEPDDEAILIEPFFDSYPASIAMAGARRISVPLTVSGNAFLFDVDRFRDAITSRTRLLFLNSPHNPTGKVFGYDELAAIAQLCIDHDIIVVSDEVYEHLTFDGSSHVSIAQLPGMRERTLRISSAAKTFNVTGWKVGWVSGPEHLISAVRAAKQFMTFVGSGPFQPAVAYALTNEWEWVARSRDSLEVKRDLVSAALVDAGFGVYPSSGTYFLVSDPRPLGCGDGLALCRALPAKAGVVGVPVSALTDNGESFSHMVRFAFAKRHDTLCEAADRLQRVTPSSLGES